MKFRAECSVGRWRIWERCKWRLCGSRGRRGGRCCGKRVVFGCAFRGDLSRIGLWEGRIGGGPGGGWWWCVSRERERERENVGIRGCREVGR